MAGAPVVVGTSLLGKNGQVKPPSQQKSSVDSDPGGLMKALISAIGGQAVSDSPTNTASVGSTVLPVPTSDAYSKLGMTAGQEVASSPSTILAQATTPTSSVNSGWSPLQLAAALRIAGKQEGPFDASPYASEIASLQSQAGLQRTQAQHGAAAAEADDAALYGSLENYVHGIAGQAHAGNVATEKATQAGFAAASQAINDVYNKGLSDVQAVNNSRGITGGTTAMHQAQAFQNGQIQTDKASNIADVLASANDNANNLRQTQIDVHTTGTGKVASQREALNTALENIAISLSGQLGSVGSSEASAESSYNQQLRQAALALMANNAKNNPNTLDNRAKQLAYDQALLNFKQDKDGTGSAASTTGESKLGKADSYLESSGLPKANLGTDLGIFNQLINGQLKLGSQTMTIPSSGIDSQELGEYAKAIRQNTVINREKQGFTDADQQAIIQALHLYLGK